MTDKIICQALTYDCYIGFHEGEGSTLQTLTIALEATFDSIPEAYRDRVEQIRFDYYAAHLLIRGLIEGKRFNLIETVGDTVARALLAAFPILAVTVKVTKQPPDISTTALVSYECHRRQGE